ncbi:MAG: sodium/solute symporter [Verrucomicrobiota bacterium]|nr:sodium/solute symporter [Verrucomicrobiota bacterium]
MASFSWLDYTIFGAYLAASVLIGLRFVKGQESLNDYFLAGRNMNRFVVAMTILAALFSGISYLAGPAEVYTSGFGYAFVLLSFFIATPFTAIWMLPHFYNRRYFTAYQFLQERFSLSVRLLASGLFIFRVSLWLAAATYAPALALKEVTGLPLWFTILCTGLVTTIYTVLGGMKAVIWTDVMQLVVLFGGQVLIMSVALSKIPGGLAGVWEINLQDHRFDLSFSFDPRERVTFWAAIIGGAFLSLVQMATDQVSVQRYLTAGSLREAQRSLWIKLWMVLPVVVVFYGSGLVLYAFYKNVGDPLAAGDIARADQILPYFVVKELPAGLPGLLIAAIFAASMSTVSAGVNSLTSATLCDFYQTLSGDEPLSERALLARARWLTLFYGVLIAGLAFGIAAMQTNLVESVNAIIGLVGGPLLGLFLLGMFTTETNTRGALTGCLSGFAVLLFLFFYKTAAGPEMKPATLVSFLWFTMIGCAVTMAVGMIVSVLTPARSACETT